MRYCCVPSCRSSQRRKQDGVSFHEIPADSASRERWLTAISRDEWMPNTTSNYSVVCSLHFLPSDFKDGCTRRVLKLGAVPSVFDDPAGETAHTARVAKKGDGRIHKRKREPSPSSCAVVSSRGNEMETGGQDGEPLASVNASLSEPVEETTSLLSGNHHEGLTEPEMATDLTVRAQAEKKQDFEVFASGSARKKASIPYKRSRKVQTAASASS
ncbi:hypothetical protein HPB52_024210 [Rhipicephalus sanguineus]|uniref:THAP-type domain-containing protein n=1 Tax=Rhipicephalus sanguineus TaxID=34632 RepID=A0A9D4TCP4_RHISA|nr:hypothetical protein HPB52_024210 [Rhipicephalus sanguineus]